MVWDFETLGRYCIKHKAQGARTWVACTKVHARPASLEIDRTQCPLPRSHATVQQNLLTRNRETRVSVLAVTPEHAQLKRGPRAEALKRAGPLRPCSLESIATRRGRAHQCRAQARLAEHVAARMQHQAGHDGQAHCARLRHSEGSVDVGGQAGQCALAMCFDEAQRLGCRCAPSSRIASCRCCWLRWHLPSCGLARWHLPSCGLARSIAHESEAPPRSRSTLAGVLATPM